MTDEQVFTNGRIVTPTGVLRGTVHCRDGSIAAIETGTSRAAGALHLEGDWLLPGLVELHTDNLERQFTPRPGVRWPSEAAMLQHDAQVAMAGITTVCDAVMVGYYGGKSERLELLQLSLDAMRRAQAAEALRADHLLHLRLELADADVVTMFRPLIHEPHLVLVSFNDHTPGQRQWHDLALYRRFHMGRTVNSEAEFDRLVKDRQAQRGDWLERNLETLLDMLEGHRAVRASHDDTTEEHVEEALALGVTISEFPTTLLAARRAHAAGMRVVMGAPNFVLGGSHSGNVSAVELASQGLLDAFSSDYVPASLLQAAFGLARRLDVPIERAIATVTANPAEMLGLADRGRIAPGLRADLVRVREIGTTPSVIAAWREGRRIA